jgi:predicted DNA-binding transcriptional regulator AlpA
MSAPGRKPKPPLQPHQRELVTVQETAALLGGIAVSQVWALHREGAMPAPVYVGNRTLWRVQELREWILAGCPARSVWRWEPVVVVNARRLLQLQREELATLTAQVMELQAQVDAGIQQMQAKPR